MYNRLIEENDANKKKRRKNKMRMKRCVWRYVDIRIKYKKNVNLFHERRIEYYEYITYKML